MPPKGRHRNEYRPPSTSATNVCAVERTGRVDVSREYMSETEGLSREAYRGEADDYAQPLVTA